jgi:hypothetical protein
MELGKPSRRVGDVQLRFDRHQLHALLILREQPGGQRGLLHA